MYQITFGHYENSIDFSTNAYTWEGEKVTITFIEDEQGNISEMSFEDVAGENKLTFEQPAENNNNPRIIIMSKFIEGTIVEIDKIDSSKTEVVWLAPDGYHIAIIHNVNFIAGIGDAVKAIQKDNGIGMKILTINENPVVIDI